MGKQSNLHIENSIGLKECSCRKDQSKLQWSPLFAKRNYSGRVLLDNWFEDTCAYKKNKYDHISEYVTEYGVKPYTANPRSIIWDATIRDEGNDALFENYIDKMEESYITSYYLSYKLLPELAKRFPNQPRAKSRHIDEMPKKDEQFLNYGNQENYGLGDYKKYSWELRNNDPRSTAESINEITYVKPDDESYKFRRWPLIRSVKGKYGDVYRPLPPDHPRRLLRGCNPLTWEC